MILLDTNALIGLLRGTAPQLVDRLAAELPHDRATSVVVVAELLVGIHKSTPPGRGRAALDDLLADLVVLDFDRPSAHAYAEIRAHSERLGQRIGNNDLLIAATARANGATLVTRNVGEFERVPGLVVEPF